MGRSYDTIRTGEVAFDRMYNWNDDAAVKILKNCRRAIRDSGKLLLIEHVLKPPNELDLGRFMDLTMLVLVTGRERTEAEFATLLREAGFSLTQVIPTTGLSYQLLRASRLKRSAPKTYDLHCCRS